LVQAQYWHDPLQEDEYKEYSQFIGPINNEQTTNPDYIENLKKLENFVMIMFTKDTMVVPKESAHFAYYAPGQDSKILPLFESDIFTTDRLGLQHLNSTGRLHFLEMEGDHLQFTEDDFVQQIVPFLT